MGLRISTNMAAMAASRELATNSNAQAKSAARLASGNRITQAGDDAAGLAISENLRAQIRSTNQAERNANDGISFVQVAEGGLSEISSIMIRLRELAIQGASDTVGDKERGFINKEAMGLAQEVDRIANTTAFNGTPLLNGQAPKGDLEFQVGTHNNRNDKLIFAAGDNDVRASTIGVDSLSYTSIDDARDAIDKIDKGMNHVSETRARLGALQSRLQTAVNNLGTTKENLSAAHSRIADTDVATEASELARANILQSAGVAVLAQANQAPAVALKLIG